MAAANWGRSVFVPEAVSSNMRMQPASLSAAICGSVV